MTAHAHDAGFTLLELLVSIALLAMLSLALVSGLRFGARIWDRSQSVNIDTNTVRAVQKEIALNLARIYPKYIVASPTDAFIDFDGLPRRMMFLSTGYAESGGMMRVSLEAANDDEGLMLQYGSVPELARSGTPVQNRALLRHLKSLDFAYFGATGTEKTSVWHQTWQHERSLPDLIRIRATTPRATATWTELIVRPKIAADTGCTFDPISKFCQGRQ